MSDDPLTSELRLIEAAALPLPQAPHPWSLTRPHQAPPRASQDDPSGAAWREAAHEVVERHDRALGRQGRPSGAIYTPRALAQAMVGWALDQAPAAGPLRVLEPGCGAGRLLIPLVAGLLRRGMTPQAVLEAIEAEEIDEGAAAVARRVVWLALEGRVGWPLEPDPVVVADSLSPERVAREGFAVVIGNPPYVFGEGLSEERREELERFELARAGGVDLFRLFIEATLTRVRPGGVHALLVPDALLARDALADVRRWYLERARLLGVGRCGRPFRAATPGGGRRVVGTGAALVIGRRVGGASAEGAPDVLVRRWSGRRFDAGRRLAAEAVPRTGAPWPVAAPSWWFGPSGLKARLEEGGARVADVLLEGASGATRGEEVGRRALEPLGEGRVAVLTGREVGRMAVARARLGMAAEAARKPQAIYAGPRALVVKTGSTPVAAADSGSAIVLQSVYVLHTAPGGPWDPWTLAATLASAWLGCYALFRWTAVKAVQPQMTLGNVRALPLPPRLDFAALRPIARRLHQLAPDDEGRAALERRCDQLVGEGFGVTLQEWAPRLRAALAPLPATQRPAWCGAG